MYSEISKKVFLTCLCLFGISGIHVESAQAGWFGDNICCNSGSLVGNGDGNAGANLSGGSSGSSGSNGGSAGGYIASVSTRPIPSNARYAGQQVVNGVTYDVWEYAGSGTATGPNLVSRVADIGGNGSNGGSNRSLPATGFFDGITPETCSVYGWAYDPDSSGQSISVHVYKDNRAGLGTYVTSCLANQSRPDVNSTVRITGNHGFVCQLPVSYRNTGDHALFIHAIDINGSPNNLLQANGKVLGCGPLPVADISIQNFEITDTCTIDEMSANDTCPQTKVSFIFNNTGTKNIAAGTNMPYQIEYHLPTDAANSPWRVARTGSYTGGVSIGGQTPAILQTVANLPVGRSVVRVVANPARVASLETNFSNNTSVPKSITYQAANTELSFSSFTVTDTCDTSAMVGNKKCPNTTVTFTLQNAGNRSVLSGQGVPYRVEYKPSTSATWLVSSAGTFNGIIPAQKDGSRGMSAPIAVVVKDLELGSTELRAIVNPAPGKPILNEINFSNNTSQVITQKYQFDVATITFAPVESIVRNGESTTIKWTVNADYSMNCTMTGALSTGNGASVSFAVAPGNKSGDILSSALSNEQTFGITCTPQSGPGVPPDIVTKSTRVEVVPSVQET